MQLQTAAGLLPSQRQSSGTPNAPGGTFGEMLMSELNPVYYSLVKAGKVFQLGGTAMNPTAFTGGAAGTPLLGLYNPAGSGLDLVILSTSLTTRTTGSAAATAQGANYWGVNQGGVNITGTQTQARNLYSQQATGSTAYGMVNVANTGSLASSFLRSGSSFGNIGATAGVNVTPPMIDDIKGALIVAPGCYLAYGMVQGFTAGSLDASIVWAEIPA